MRADDGGCVVNVSSVNGQHAAPMESHYSAAKAAIIRLTETLAVEWSGDGVRVNCVAPGLIQTPGATQLTRTPSSAHSTASVRVRFSTPALAAEYGARPARPRDPQMLETLTICPQSGDSNIRRPAS